MSSATTWDEIYAEGLKAGQSERDRLERDRDALLAALKEMRKGRWTSAVIERADLAIQQAEKE